MKAKVYGKTLFLLLTLFVVSCGENGNSRTEGPSEENPIIDGEKKFVKTSESILVEQFDIRLKPEVFEVPLLLKTQFTQSAPQPLGRSLKNKVVYFKDNGKEVALFESAENRLNLENPSSSNEILLAKLPVVSRIGEDVVVDFAGAMNTFDVAPSVGLEANPTSFISAESTYLENVFYTADVLHLKQFVQLPGNSLTVEYSISAYLPDENFKPKRAARGSMLGYFNTQRLFSGSDQRSFRYALRFHPERNIVFYLSPHIPAAYKESVKDGLLYWNQAFGTDKIVAREFESVEEYEEALQYDISINIIKWIKADRAGFAYSDSSFDPLTGQILNSDVYLTSSYVLGSVGEARARLSSALEDLQKSNKAIEARLQYDQLKPRGFELGDTHRQVIDAQTYKLHAFSQMKSISNLLQKIESNGSLSGAELTDQQKDQIVLRYTQDIMRALVAHEIGHSLGLRHNFSGNFNSTLRPETVDLNVKEYLLEDKLLAGQVVSSTTMDYFSSELDALVGAHIRKNKTALEYDKAAIQWGYIESEQRLAIETLQNTQFCSDEQTTGDFKDCRRFDYFKNPMDESIFQIQTLPQNFVQLFFQGMSFLKNPRYVSQGLPEDRIKVDIQLINFPIEFLGRSMANTYVSRLSLFDESLELWELKKRYSSGRFLTLDKLQYKSDRAEYINNNFGSMTLGQTLLSPLKLSDPSAKKMSSGKVAIDSIDQIWKLYLTQRNEAFPNLAPALIQTMDEKILTSLIYTQNLFLEKYLIAFEKLVPIVVPENRDQLAQSYVQVLTRLISMDLENEFVVAPVNNELEDPTVVSEYYFNQNHIGEFDLRTIMMLALNFDFFPENPSFAFFKGPLIAKTLEDLQKKLDVIMRIHNDEGKASAEAIDWFLIEKKRIDTLKKKLGL